MSSPNAPVRRELTLALGLLAGGAGIVLLASSRRWFDVAVPRSPVTPSEVDLLTGGRVAGSAFALGLVGLAGVVAVLASRGAGRRIVGGILAATGLGIVVASLTAAPPTDVVLTVYGEARHVEFDPTAWRVVSAIGGLLLLAGGLLVAVRSGRWPAMGRRYDAPTGRGPGAREDGDPWAALDRGEDPTLPGEPPDARPQ